MPSNTLLGLIQADQQRREVKDLGPKPVDTKAILEQNRDRPFVRRILRPETGGFIQNQDGSVSTHRMAAEVGEDGRVFAFPTILEGEDGRLREFEDPFEAMMYARRTGDAIEFDDIQSALSFTKNYKTNEFQDYWRGKRRLLAR